MYRLWGLLLAYWPTASAAAAWVEQPQQQAVLVPFQLVHEVHAPYFAWPWESGDPQPCQPSAWLGTLFTNCHIWSWNKSVTSHKGVMSLTFDWHDHDPNEIHGGGELQRWRQSASIIIKWRNSNHVHSQSVETPTNHKSVIHNFQYFLHCYW